MRSHGKIPGLRARFPRASMGLVLMLVTLFPSISPPIVRLLFLTPFAASPTQNSLPGTLRTISQVRSLAAEQAATGVPVELEGIMTYVDAPRYMSFLADDTGGIFMEIGPGTRRHAGERVRVTGITAAGIFTPIIRPKSVSVVSTNLLPSPRPVSLAELKSGLMDAERIQLDAQVRSVQRVDGYLKLKLFMEEGFVFGWIPETGWNLDADLIGSKIRAQGVCAGTFGPKNEALGFDIFCQDSSSIAILHSDSRSLDQIPLRPIRQLGADWRNSELSRAHCRGRVTFHSPGRFLFVQDSTGTVELRVDEPLNLQPGDEVEAAGFRVFSNEKVLLDSCIVRKIGILPPMQPQRFTLREIYSRLGHGDSAIVEGRLAAVVHQPQIRFKTSAPGDFATQPVLVMRAGEWFFRAELPTDTPTGEVNDLRPGSLLSLSGVVAAEPTEPSEPRTYKLLLNSMKSVQILEAASWWSRERALAVGGGSTALVLGMMGWAVGLTQRRRRHAEQLVKRNQEQTILHQSVLLELGRITRDSQNHSSLQRITELVAHTLQVHRVGVWLYEQDAGTMHCLDLWDGHTHKSGDTLRTAAYPAYFAALSENRCLSSSDARNDPRTREFRGGYLEDNQIFSMLDVPFQLGGRQGGVLCLEQTVHPRAWTVVEESFAAGVADQLTILMESRARAQAESSLREAHAELELRVMLRTTELAEARDRAESADRLKSAFLATMSHELRTPLNSIIGFTGIILQGLVGSVTPEQQKQLGMVMNSAKHLLSLINDVLDLSRIEAGQMEIRSEVFDIQDSAERAIQIIAPLAARKNLPLLSPPRSSPLPVTADPRRTEQILINLIANAVKFTEKGQVRISATQCPDGTTALSVEDSGVGIRAEDLPRIFKPFQQLDTGLTRQHEGTGLGLAICDRLVRLMGGTVRVKSQSGVGSTFTLHLPTASRDN